ncbi:MAG TPA: DUF4097 family beta strand repeat-containing protein [bacterium]|nr:DUF4097 family beta strand repeat-containing protein [bacterium]HPN44450.1 DUF4097 family beta strand repeat-containing protein [bacterium]
MNKLQTTIVVGLLIFAGTAFSRTVTKEFEQTVDLAAEGTVNVKNVNGKIFVESWDNDEVHIYAVIEVKASSSSRAEEFIEQVEIKVEKSGDELYIQPEHPKARGEDFFKMLFGSHNPSVQVDFTVQVPRNVQVDLNSVNGTIETVNLAGLAKLQTVNGKISAKEMHSAVDAGTTNGGIEVEIDESNLSNDMRLHTVNGSISMTMPKSTAADLSMSTVNGSIHTDFPLQLEGMWSNKNVDGKINGGGNKISLGTVNGSISIYEK